MKQAGSGRQSVEHLAVALGVELLQLHTEIIDHALHARTPVSELLVGRLERLHPRIALVGHVGGPQVLQLRDAVGVFGVAVNVGRLQSGEARLQSSCCGRIGGGSDRLVGSDEIQAAVDCRSPICGGAVSIGEAAVQLVEAVVQGVEDELQSGIPGGGGGGLHGGGGVGFGENTPMMAAGVMVAESGI